VNKNNEDKNEHEKLDQRGHWKKKEEVFEERGCSRIKIIKASWTRVLFGDDGDVVFH
jgi:hypothetical protein